MILDRITTSILFCYAVVVCVCVMILLNRFNNHNMSSQDMTSFCAWTFGQTVSPLLVLCVSRITRLASAERLQKQDVVCPDPAKISKSSAVDMVAFSMQALESVTEDRPADLIKFIAADEVAPTLVRSRRESSESLEPHIKSNFEV